MPHAWTGADFCKSIIEVVNDKIRGILAFNVLDVSVNLVKVIKDEWRD
jgi:hypothetical protein